MSSLRRRSHDARMQLMPEASAPDNTGPQRRSFTTKKLTVSTTVLLTLLATFILYFRVQLVGLTSLISLGNAHKDLDIDVKSQDSYRLYPEDHAFRAPIEQRLKWRITSCLRRPDGVLKEVYLINDAFPGPTIEARPGDRIIVEVENQLDDETMSIHWHGLFMRAQNDMDGAAGITQESILPGHNFTYDFTIDEQQHGTFWYHAHDGNQRADGLYGGLIVHKTRPRTDTAKVEAQYLLMVGDWYHRSGDEALEFYSHPGGFGNEPVPDGILLNGAGSFACENFVPARPVDCEEKTMKDVPAITFNSSKRNILRIVNTGTYAGIALKVVGASLLPIEVDGGNSIAAVPTRSIGNLHPGERVMVSVEVSGEIENDIALSVSLDEKPFKYPNSALKSTQIFPIAWSTNSISTTNPRKDSMEYLDLATVKSSTIQSTTIPQTPDEVIVLYSITQKLSHLGNTPMGFINGTSWAPQAGGKSLNALERYEWDEHQFVPHIPYDASSPLWVDIVLNNLDEETHPFHLHGHDFWVLSTYSSTYNWGSYNPYENQSPPGGAYDLQYPVKKDTVAVPRRGYAVLRVKFDNLGVWMFHCHVLWHQASGMSMAFEVR